MAGAVPLVVGRAETRDRHPKTGEPLQNHRNVTLQLPGGKHAPNLDRSGMRQQIIQVPVRPGMGSQVVPQSRLETSRPESTAHVGIIPGRHVTNAQATDFLRPPPGQDCNKDVGSPGDGDADFRHPGILKRTVLNQVVKHSRQYSGEFFHKGQKPSARIG